MHLIASIRFCLIYVQPDDPSYASFVGSKQFSDFLAEVRTILKAIPAGKVTDDIRESNRLVRVSEFWLINIITIYRVLDGCWWVCLRAVKLHKHSKFGYKTE